ncbi:hypothetical protein AAE478_005810 [Parahypoxylon ruwenzoriense]
MSSRQLRKLQKQKELQNLQANNPTNDAESSEDDIPIQKPRASLFSGFAALGDRDDQEDDSGGDGDRVEDERVEVATEPTAQTDRADTPRTSSKKSKKKKKKAKRQGGTPAKAETTPQNGPDEIEQALRELELSKKPNVSTTSDPNTFFDKSYERICELLRVNTHHLRVINEMRNLFGREAIAAAQTEEEQEQTRSRRQRQPLPQHVDLETFLKGQPGKSLPEVTLRRNPFLAGKETWPRASTEGLTMEQVKDGEMHCKPGIIEFRFAHDEAYNKLEKRFFEIVQMYDPMRIVHFLHLFPYHISSLIQVSRVAKQDQNSALSADLCERALFTFGRVSVSLFRQKIEEGKARLDFRRPENRQFWLAGYHYLKNLIMKGTYRTALEWSKLLFSMDWDDPYGIIHFIHPLAIRAHESKWFIDFCDTEILDTCATAQDAQDYIRQTLVLARLQQKDAAGAKALLVEGMERLPWLYSNLFKSLNLDIPKAIWGIQPRNQDEELHTNVYLHQTKGLWDNAQTISLLKEAARERKRPDVKTFPFPPAVKTNLARFVYLLEIPSLMSLVPRELMSASINWEFDPFPPPFDENIFSYDSQTLPWAPERDEDRLGPRSAGDPRELRRLLERARQDGAPEDIQQALQEAITEVEDGNNNEGDGPRNQGDVGGLGALFQAFMDLMDPRSLARGGGDFDDSDLDNMPGGWHDDDDSESDELPPLIPTGGIDDETDDELPPLLPGSGANHAEDEADDDMPGLL